MRAAVAFLLAAACGGGSGAAGAESDPASAFRSVGVPRIVVPPPRAVSEAGVRTQYYANGRPRSHGRYVAVGERALADGVWTYWQTDGSRRSQGRFQRGEPVGCFAIWLPRGQRVTGLAERGEFRPGACVPPGDSAVEVLEAAHGTGAPAVVDIGFETFLAPWSPLGARTSKYATDDPHMTGALMALWRRHVGEARFGGSAGVRGAEFGYYGLTAAGLAGWGRQLTGWLGVEAWGELGLLFMQAKPQLEDHREGREYLWTPIIAGEAEAAWRLATSLELTTGVRLELRYPRSVDRQTVFCRAPCDAMTDTWKTSGIAAGLVVGLRFLVW